MSRRRSGAKRITFTGIAACLFLLPLALASPQQEQKQPHRRFQPEHGRQADRVPASRVDLQDGSLDNPDHKHFKDTTIDSSNPSAIATFAPAISNAVRAPKPAHGSGNAGLASLLNARSLQDWEVEDFVLLATVDGSIYARDRHTGAYRWAMESVNAMVETTYHRANKSTYKDYRPEDDYLWIVEPSKDGDIYIYNQAHTGGLQRLHLTVKKLAEELSPYAGDDPAVVYTAEKTTYLYTVDAATGTITRIFSSKGSTVHDEHTCRTMNPLDGQDEQECGTSGSLMLGRTEYTVGIQHRESAEPICTLRYFEWGPNNRDSDLVSQYSSTMDQKYVYSRHDGSVFGFDHAKMEEKRRAYTQKLPSPVVRVFDVARPLDGQGESISRDTQLVVLPQPIAPTNNDYYYDSIDDKNRIFVNRTNSGGWFAMSEHSYPYVTGGAAKAQCYNQDWLDVQFPAAAMSLHHQQDALVGVHSLTDRPAEASRQFLTISGPPEEKLDNTPADTEPSPLSSAFALKNSKIIQGATNSALDVLISLIILFAIAFLGINHKHFFKWLRRNLDLNQLAPKVADGLASPPTSPIGPVHPNMTELGAPTIENHDFATDNEATPPIERTDPVILENVPSPRSRAQSTASDLDREKVGPRVRIVEPSPSPENDDGAETPTPGAKKKARRGTRGGAKHKKKKNGQAKAIEESEAVENAVQEALDIAGDQPPPIEKEVETVKNTNVSDVSGPVIKIGHLEVNTDVVLGFGSHGTVVYRGSFGGRDVAVKRMLQDFYNIASHEVGLLQESDDHPNVIRYYDKESAGQFLYIALELCPASLQDVVEKPASYPDLLGMAGLDLPNVLKQITAGLQYLHSLKIVHRDIKPQNILVSAPKRLPRNPDVFQPPRLLISDFGLCKKLEGDQSSFRATTAHAAGTSGWRAPELLVDEDAVNHAAASNSSMPASGHSSSEPLVLDTQTNRRATRAIDIFSLGCVFYYVLTGGSHPFDRDGKFMREGNIIKGNYTLTELDRLGDYQWEAKDLVASMLDLEPRHRPDAQTILAHPFFWDAQKRLDFLCQVSDQFEFEPRDPPSPALQALEDMAPDLLSHCQNDFLRNLPQQFKDTLGKQRKYSGHKLLDLLRALRNKKNHYEDMPEDIKKKVGPLPEGYLGFWTRRFPGLLMACHEVVIDVGWTGKDRFKSFYKA